MRRYTALCMTVALALAGRVVAAESAGPVLFADTFEGPELSSQWEVIEGAWGVEDGALTCRDGGTIALNVPTGGRFAFEFEIKFPSNWMSVIPFFTGPEDYGTLYFTGGYWETFEMAGTAIANYVQRRDPEIARTGGFQRIRIVSEYGVLTFTYDGKAKGPALLPSRPGARVAFRSLPRSGLLSIRNFRLEQLSDANVSIVHRAAARDLARGVVYEDRGAQGRRGDAARLAVDTAADETKLSYQFTADAQFESCFVRLPMDAPACSVIALDVEADGSKNNLFVIVHDSSGEQHLVTNAAAAWSGRQEVGVNLTPFLQGPLHMERHADHWGGDGNQKLDFPITAIDIGVVKRGTRTKNAGQMRFGNLRFVE